MKIGIIVAMSKELGLILPLLTSPSRQQHAGITFHIGKIGPHDIIAMECGIGKVNAAMGATLMAQIFEPRLIINTGVAAGAGPDVSVMDTVVATSLVHHDFWCIGEEWGRVPGCPRIFETRTYADAVDGPNVKRGIIASGDMFITSREQVDAIRGHYPAVLAVDMESVAIAQACYVRGVPYFCMRVISDTPWCHHDNSSQYEDFWEAAPRQSFGLIKTMLERI